MLGFLAAPAIVRAASLMAVKVLAPSYPWAGMLDMTAHEVKFRLEEFERDLPRYFVSDRMADRWINSGVLSQFEMSRIVRVKPLPVT